MTNSPDRHVLTGEQAKGNPSGDEFVELERAHKEALNVVQWLARMACSYVTSGDPERRVDLDYRAAEAALTTKTFAEDMALRVAYAYEQATEWHMRRPDLAWSEQGA